MVMSLKCFFLIAGIDRAKNELQVFNSDKTTVRCACFLSMNKHVSSQQTEMVICATYNYSTFLIDCNSIKHVVLDLILYCDRKNPYLVKQTQST
jgi:hypothetical protein